MLAATNTGPSRLHCPSLRSENSFVQTQAAACETKRKRKRRWHARTLLAAVVFTGGLTRLHNHSRICIGVLERAPEHIVFKLTRFDD